MDTFSGRRVDGVRGDEVDFVTGCTRSCTIQEVELDVVEADFGHSVDIYCEVQSARGVQVVFERNHEFAVPTRVAADLQLDIRVLRYVCQIVLGVGFGVEGEGEAVVGEVVVVDLVEHEVEHCARMGGEVAEYPRHV